MRRLSLTLFVLAAALAVGTGSAAASPVPVILDTDIGGDVDDTWALAYLLRSPEIDLKLVLTDSGDTVYRARVAARLLEVAGRTDVPVGIGIRQSEEGGPQGEWVEGYDLESYPGTVHRDGVEAMIELIRSSEKPITVVAIGPAPNLEQALERAPDIAGRARFVGMYGSVRVGYDGKRSPDAEWNVRADPSAVQAIFAAPWEVTITPLDTCGLLKLTGERYAAVRDSQDPLARAILDNYRLWLPHVDWLDGDPTRPERESTTLFDVVAVYLAFSEEWVEIEEIGLRVTGEGHTVEDPSGRPVRCALRWKDRAALEEQIVTRLTREAAPAVENSPNALRLAPSASPGQAKIADLAWLAGYWTGDGLGGMCEELWMPPSADRMYGTFTLAQEGKIVFSEAMLMVEEEGSVVLRVKHFDPAFVGWEEKDGYVSFPLVRVGENEAYFNGLTFRRDGDQLAIYLVLESGGERTEDVFRLRRQSL